VRASLYQREDFRNMISFIEKQTGNKIDEDRLKQILLEIRRQDELISELTELQTIIPNPVPVVYILFMYGGNFLMGGTREYTEMLEYMVDKAKNNAKRGIAGTASGKEKARGLFCYIDHYTTDLRFWEWLDKNDISHLGSILSLFWQDGAAYSVGKEDQTYKIDPTNLNTMLESLAELGSRRPMVKSIRGPYDAPGMWLDDTLGAAKLLKADFVIYIGTIGCRNTWGMVKLLANDLERQGIPTLILYADAFDDRVQSWEAVVDKMNEFLHLRKIIE
ncbi:MAG TPA: 2-hydroxyacyl-CoA dehydratase, partial [Deltaproteobacteria bacterium]|nr:2-hydroxyacyl-CoA dehydratase [Deltaproteobacteria bacterium]